MEDKFNRIKTQIYLNRYDHIKFPLTTNIH